MFSFDINNKRIVIIGLGNNYRKDDSIGLYIVKKIKKRDNFLIISTENSLLEDYIETIIKFKPEQIIIFDTADFKGASGDIRKFTIDDLINIKNYSTHTIPMRFIFNYIKEHLPEIEIIIYAIQPKDIGYGVDINKDVLINANKIIKLINNTKIN